MTRESAKRIIISVFIFGIVGNSNDIEMLRTPSDRVDTTTFETAISTDGIEFSILQDRSDGQYGIDDVGTYKTSPDSRRAPFFIDRASMPLYSVFDVARDYIGPILNLIITDFNIYSGDGKLLDGSPTSTANFLSSKLDTKPKIAPRETGTFTLLGLGIIGLLILSKFLKKSTKKTLS